MQKLKVFINSVQGEFAEDRKELTRYIRLEIMDNLQLKHRSNFMEYDIQPAMDAEYIEMTNPKSPKSAKQKYRLTSKGKAYRQK